MKANATGFCTTECRTEQESPDNRQGLYEKEYGLSAPSSLRRPARAADRAGFDRSERFQSPPELFRTESPGTGRQHDPGRADPCRYAPFPQRRAGRLLARMRREAFSRGRLAGWETIRAKICPMSDAEAEDFAIAENLQREDITPFEQGQAFKRLIDTRRYDVGTLALHFGRTRDFVLSRIRLLDLIPEVIELLNSEEINISQALELCRYEKEIQREVYDGYFKMGLDCHWRHLRAKELRSRLAGMYLSQLNSYRFDKTECASCASNKANQVLFADCGDCNVCQNRACMKRKNTEYLVAEAKRLLSECPGIRIGYFEDCSQGEVLQALRDESRPVRALGYAGYYEAHPEKPEEPRRENFTEEADYTESINTFRSASEEYEQECADIQRRVEAGELIRYAVIGDRGIEFYYDEPIPVTEEPE